MFREDRKVRDRALSSLRTYLQRSGAFTALDILKLWKGLFYCLWMQDKPRNQQRLARDLADLVDALNTKENVVGFIEGFWKTMAREWADIDALRMDKYLYLVRCYVGKGFEVCAKKGWDKDKFLDEYLSILAAIPLSVRDSKVPNGLRYHIIDVYVDELEKADAMKKIPLNKVLAPLRRLGKETITKTVRTRVQEALDDKRLVVKTHTEENKDTGKDDVNVLDGPSEKALEDSNGEIIGQKN